MRIDCPNCGFSREVPDHKLPATATTATCPKCKSKFRFRETPDLQEFVISSETPDAPPTPADLGAGRRDAASGEARHEPADERDFPNDTEEVEPPRLRSTGDGPRQGDEGETGDIWSRLEEMDREDQAGGEPDDEREPLSGEVPWERLDKHGFFGGLLATLKAPMTRPAEFFATMPVTGGLGRPLAFYLLVGMIDTLAQLFWSAAITSMPFVSGGDAGSEPGMDPLGFGISSTAFIVLLPLLITVGVFITAGVIHFCLRVFGAGDAGFQATFRVVTYGYAPNILGVIPLIGGLVGGLWSLYLYFVGLKHVHRTSYAKVALAALLPLLIMTAAVTLFVTMSPSDL